MRAPIRILLISAYTIPMMVCTQLSNAQTAPEYEWPTSYMKRPNPNILYVDLGTSDGCTGSFESVVDLVLVQSAY